MKKVTIGVLAFSLALALAFSPSFAGMGGAKQDGTDSSQMKGGQMMSRDMMMDMTVMMKHMNEMMERLSHPMHHMTVTDHRQMYDLGMIMRKMAAEMNELAGHMEKGQMSEAASKEMREKMKTLNDEIEALRKKNN